MNERTEKRMLRAAASEFETRDDDGPVIEGYFAVFGQNYELTSDMSESIAPGAFRDTLSGDIRALINHDTSLVLGRTTSHTLELREDSRGLWGRIRINPKDTDAMNLYERVKRGDVSQCSIGFDILNEDVTFDDAGKTHWTINEIKLYEVSCCTFPAYTETAISARSIERDAIKERATAAWRERMTAKLNKGGHDNGTEGNDAQEEN